MGHVCDCAVDLFEMSRDGSVIFDPDCGCSHKKTGNPTKSLLPALEKLCILKYGKVVHNRKYFILPLTCPLLSLFISRFWKVKCTL